MIKVSVLRNDIELRAEYEREQSSVSKAMTIQTLEQAQKEAVNLRKEVELEAKDLKLKLRSDFEQETKDTRQELKELEKRLMQREENLDRKVEIGRAHV